MNENPANDYYPKDFFQSQKKEEQSLNQNTNSKTEINSFDENYCEEL